MILWWLDGDYFGKPGRILLQVVVLVNNIGFLIVYMIIIADVLSGKTEDGIHHSGVLEGLFGDHWWNGRAAILTITTLGVFAPLACFKWIDSLRFTSALSTGGSKEISERGEPAIVKISKAGDKNLHVNGSFQASPTGSSPCHYLPSSSCSFRQR